MTSMTIDIAAGNDAAQVVESAIQKVKNIATLPAVTHKIMKLVDDPDSSIEDLSKVITSDPALCTRILKVVNSSFYGMAEQIGSIDRAVTLLGLNAVKNIAIASSLHKVFKSKQTGDNFDARDLWIHSVAVATGAREISATVRLGLPDEAFLAGLIHDIGVMVEMQACSQGFDEIINMLSDDENLTFRQAEEQVLGATHEVFGAALCKAWHFPLHLGNVAGFHHLPLQLPNTDRLMSAIVHVADIMAARIGVGYTRTVETDVINPELLSMLNLDESMVDAIASTLPEAIEESQQLLSDG